MKHRSWGPWITRLTLFGWATFLLRHLAPPFISRTTLPCAIAADLTANLLLQQQPNHEDPLPPTQQPSVTTTATISPTESLSPLQEEEEDLLLLDRDDEDDENDATNNHIQAKKTVEVSEPSEVIVVALVDGTLAGLDRLSGRTLWKREASAQDCPLVQPLIATTTTVKAEDRWRTAAIPSILDGKVYLTTTTNQEEAALEDCDAQVCSIVEDTVTASIRNLVHRAPFVDYNRGGRIYTAQRQSVAVALDRRTGATLRTISTASSGGDGGVAEGAEAPNVAAAVDDALWLGRVDYTISIHEPLSGELDVQFTMAEMMSIQDMLLTDDDTTHRQLLRQYLLPQNRVTNEATSTILDDKWLSFLPNVIVATPRGNIAYRNPNTGDILWVAEETFDTPIVYAFDALSGRSLGVDMVPDAVTPHGSAEHVSMEMQRQLQNSLAAAPPQAQYAGGLHHRSPLEAAQPVFGALPGSGQLFAIPLRLTAGLHQHHHVARDRHFRNPFPDHHLADAHAGAVVPFYHPDYGYHYVPPEHFYTLQPVRRRRFKKLFLFLGSWIIPVIFTIFVTSFELGRRKRLHDEQKARLRLSAIPGKYPETSTVDEGIIQVDETIVLGHGGHGTVVFKGMLEGRAVAVKRMLKTYHASADREISLLIESDGHPNVVRYHLKEMRGDFVFLALELCDLSLHDLIGHVRGRLDRIRTEEEKKKLFAATKAILFQVTKGVEHLHRLRIVHRDLKPANILLADARNQSSKKLGSINDAVCDIFERGGYVAKISDMGLGKQLIGHSSYGSGFNNASLLGESNGVQSSVIGIGPGSVGWQAPEVMALRSSSDITTKSDEGSNPNDTGSDFSPIDVASTNRTSRSVDIFSLGCVFYSTILPGSHPFGEWYEREANIMHNRPNLQSLEALSLEAHDLIAAMLQRSPSARPTARLICEHPFFWSSNRRLSFLCDLSDRIEQDAVNASSSDPPDAAFSAKLLVVEKNALKVVGMAWDRVLDPDLIRNVQRFRTYDSSSVRDLLRLIRNKYHHFDELPDAFRSSIGSKTEGLLIYFDEKFPRLLLHCYNVCQAIFSSNDELSIKYAIAPLMKVAKPIRGSVLCSVESDINGSSQIENNNHDIQECLVFADSVQEHPDVVPMLHSEPTLAPVPEEVASVDWSDPPSCMNVSSSEVLPMPSVSGNGAVEDEVIIWFGSTAAKAFQCRGWYRSDDEWQRKCDVSSRRTDTSLPRCAEDPKYRTRLCNHWDTSVGTFCPMRKKNKCIFAHGPVELRVKEAKRNRWGKLVDINGDCNNPNHSGGEDTYGAARSIESERKQEGKWKGKTPNGAKRKT